MVYLKPIYNEEHYIEVALHSVPELRPLTVTGSTGAALPKPYTIVAWPPPSSCAALAPHWAALVRGLLLV